MVSVSWAFKSSVIIDLRLSPQWLLTYFWVLSNYWLTFESSVRYLTYFWVLSDYWLTFESSVIIDLLLSPQWLLTYLSERQSSCKHLQDLPDTTHFQYMICSPLTLTLLPLTGLCLPGRCLQARHHFRGGAEAPQHSLATHAWGT
jgi:hypothetical protein